MSRRLSTHFFYEQRINKVLNTLSANVAHPFRLEELGVLACLSPFHLHRVFRAMTGETLGAHIRRIRLEAAANKLWFSHDQITQIAHCCGFSSSQNFARMFREWAGMSPRQFRNACLHKEIALTEQNSKQRNVVMSASGYGVALEGGADRAECFPQRVHLDKGEIMKVEIKTLPGYRVAYVRHIGPYGPELGEAWMRITEWAGKKGLLGPHTAAIGVSWDNPELTPPQHCRYDACVVLPDTFTVPEQDLVQSGISVQTLPNAEYACYRRPTRMDEYFRAWKELFDVWLPESGYTCVGAGFEYYHPPLSCSEDPAFACDVSFCIPVRQEKEYSKDAPEKR